MKDTDIYSGSLFKPKHELFLLCSLAFFLIFILTALTPIVCDDYNYSWSWFTNEKIENLYDLKMSILYHWEMMNGRYFSHLFAFFFLWQDKAWFNLANGLMAGLLTLIISRYVSLGKGETKSTMLCLTFIFCFMPVWGQVFLWLDGACNYSWALVFTLTYLYPYCAAWFGKQAKYNFMTGILFIPFSFVAGAYLENGSLAVIGISLVLMAIMALKKERFSFWLIPAFLSACFGFYFMISAPSEKNRGSFSIIKALSKFSSVFSAVPGYIYIILAAGIILFIAIVIILLKKRQKLFVFLGATITAIFFVLYILSAPDISGMKVYECLRNIVSSTAWSLLSISLVYALLLLSSIFFQIDRKVLFFSVLLFLAGAGSIAVFLFAKYIPARGFMHYVAFLAIASVLMLGELKSHISPIFAKPFSCAICAYSCLCLILGSADVVEIHSVSQSRLNTIEQSKANGIYEVAVPAFESKTKYSAPYQLEDVKDDWEKWPNPVMARYHGVDKIYRDDSKFS